MQPGSAVEYSSSPGCPSTIQPEWMPALEGTVTPSLQGSGQQIRLCLSSSSTRLGPWTSADCDQTTSHGYVFQVYLWSACRVIDEKLASQIICLAVYRAIGGRDRVRT
jgi:hypothetical protein